MTEVQVDYQIKEWYMVANFFEYRSDNLIIFYHCVYFELLGTIGVIVWNSIKLREIQGLVLRLIGDGMEFDLHWKRV